MDRLHSRGGGRSPSDSAVDRGVEIKKRAADARPCGRLGGVERFVDLCVTHTEELLRRVGVGLELCALLVEELREDLRLLLARLTRRAEAKPVGKTLGVFLGLLQIASAADRFPVLEHPLARASSRTRRRPDRSAA